jgi:serine/threonine protein kinase
MAILNQVLQDRYRIIRPIAEGGMGAVYEAADQRLGSTVALKESFFSQESLLQAFHREAALLATLRHRGLPKVIDHFGSRQQILMRIKNPHPENIQGYRLRIDGSVETLQGTGEDQSMTNIVKKLFDAQQ